MEEQEYIDIFSQLAVILSEKQLDWVVEQVNGLIKTGDVIKKDVEIFNEGWQYPSILERQPRRKRQKASLLVVKEFSARERLLLLIEAAERVLSDAIGMEQHILGELSPESDQPGVALYVSDDSEPVVINRQSNVARSVAIRRVVDLLQALRTEVS